MERLGGLLPHTTHIEIATKIAFYNHQDVGDRTAPGGTVCSIPPKTGIMSPNDTDGCAVHPLWARGAHKPPYGSPCGLGLSGRDNGSVKNTIEL